MKSHRRDECSTDPDEGCGLREGSENAWHHKFGASWLKTADLCLERARREHTGEMDNIESDAACVGTATHIGIETCLASEGLTLADQLDIAHAEFTRLMALDGTNGEVRGNHPEGRFEWIKYNEKQARKLITDFTTQWHAEILPTLSFDAVLEWGFTVPIVNNGDRYIELAGNCDYARQGDLKDWKTSGSGPYKPWEYKRWAIQPTTYTYAWHVLHGGEPLFEYVVMNSKGVQRFTVERGPEHWNWLAIKVTDMAKLIELDLASWPKNDNHALCSPKWCPAWDQCKGATGITF